jgi:hypothetical protein
MTSSKASYYGESTWWKKPVCFMAGKQKKERETIISFEGTLPVI